MKILLSDAFDDSLPGKLARFGEVTDDKSKLPEMDVVLIRSKTKCTREYIDEAKNLKMIIRGGVGLDNVDQEYAKTKNVIVHNTAEASSIAVAEAAMALMIALPNHIVTGTTSMRDGEWLKKKLKRTELYGKNLGLIGCGRIGTEVARRAAAFGMKITAYDPYIKENEFAAITHNLDDVLTKSDYISLHTPLLPETQGIINKETLAKMKDGVYIVNTGRGKCVVEEDVVEALKSGKVAGYGNDVWYSDPPENSPLVGAQNVVMLPHIGASTKENLLRIGDVIEKLIDEYTKSL